MRVVLEIEEAEERVDLVSQSPWIEPAKVAAYGDGLAQMAAVAVGLALRRAGDR